MYEFIFAGLLVGVFYFFLFERPNVDKMDMECWQKLHYLNKENSNLIMVHLKSILTGIIIIWCVYEGYKIPIYILASAIIGLHIGQAIVEFYYIKEKNKVR